MFPTRQFKSLSEGFFNFLMNSFPLHNHCQLYLCLLLWNSTPWFKSFPQQFKSLSEECHNHVVGDKDTPRRDSVSPNPLESESSHLVNDIMTSTHENNALKTISTGNVAVKAPSPHDSWTVTVPMNAKIVILMAWSKTIALMSLPGELHRRPYSRSCSNSRQNSPHRRVQNKLFICVIRSIHRMFLSQLCEHVVPINFSCLRI